MSDTDKEWAQLLNGDPEAPLDEEDQDVSFDAMKADFASQNHETREAVDDGYQASAVPMARAGGLANLDYLKQPQVTKEKTETAKKTVTPQVSRPTPVAKTNETPSKPAPAAVEPPVKRPSTSGPDAEPIADDGPDL